MKGMEERYDPHVLDVACPSRLKLECNHWRDN